MMSLDKLYNQYSQLKGNLQENLDPTNDIDISNI